MQPLRIGGFSHCKIRKRTKEEQKWLWSCIHFGTSGRRGIEELLKPRKLSQHPCCSWLKRKLIGGFGHVVPQMYLSLLWISFHIVSWVFSIFVITFLYYLNSFFSLYDMTMLFFLLIWQVLLPFFKKKDKKNPILHLWTIAKVWFSTLNYKTR